MLAIPSAETFADCFYLIPTEQNELKRTLYLGKQLRKQAKRVKKNPRMNEAMADTMLCPVGKPGSQERIEAMRVAVENNQGIFEKPE